MQLVAPNAYWARRLGALDVHACAPTPPYTQTPTQVAVCVCAVNRKATRFEGIRLVAIVASRHNDALCREAFSSAQQLLA